MAQPGGMPNTFVPQMLDDYFAVEYARNPATMPYLRYAYTKPVTKNKGYYVYITPDNAARIIGDAGEDGDWADGTPSPAVLNGSANNLEFAFESYQTKRKARGFSLGNMSIDQASFDVVKSHSAMAVQQVATLRALKAVNTVTTAANYAGQTATATSAGNGKWDASSATNNYIRKSVDYVKRAINIATLGVVSPSEIYMVVSPSLALNMSENDEILSHIKQNVWGLDTLKGDKNVNSNWGLPPTLFGLGGIVVDDTVRVSSKKGAASLTSAYAFPPNVVAFVTRKSGDGAFAPTEDLNEVPTVNSLVMFSVKELNGIVEPDAQKSNERTIGLVSENSGCNLVSPVSAYLLTAVSDLTS